MAIDIFVLQTEIVNDPKGFYGSAVVEKNITKIYSEINSTRAGASYAFNRGKILGSEIFSLIEANDYDAMTVNNRNELFGLLGMDSVDASNTATVKVFMRLFAGTSTLSNLAAYRNREGSRAEMLFGEPVTRNQIHKALIGA